MLLMKSVSFAATALKRIRAASIDGAESEEQLTSRLDVQVFERASTCVLHQTPLFTRCLLVDNHVVEHLRIAIELGAAHVLYFFFQPLTKLINGEIGVDFYLHIKRLRKHTEISSSSTAL